MGQGLGGWLKLAFALTQLALWIARKVEEHDAVDKASAQIFIEQQEKANAAIAMAETARAMERARLDANPELVREPDQFSRD